MMTLPQERLKTLCTNNPHIWMGIINLSSESFSASISFDYAFNLKEFPLKNKEPSLISRVLKQADDFIKKGSLILDIGAVPTNPGIENALVDPHQEIAILKPILSVLKEEFGNSVMFSIDTYSPTVAYELAKDNLIDIINDIYGGRKTESIAVSAYERRDITTFDVVAEFSLGYILMHMSGCLDSLKNAEMSKDNYLDDILNFFEERLEVLSKKGVSFCVLDPGIGGGRFGKNLEMNLAILSESFITKIRSRGFPVLVGLSRKSFLKELHPECINLSARDSYSKKWEHKCLEWGVNIIRTHKIFH